MVEWIKKRKNHHTIQLNAVYKKLINAVLKRFKNTRRLKAKESKRIFHANGNKRRTGVARLVSDKIDF